MVLRNYVELTPGRSSTMHFFNHHLVTKTITDPLLRVPKPVNTLLLFVDELDGQPVQALFSILAEKLAAQLAPFLEGQRYRDFVFTILATGEGFTRTYQVEPRARGAS